MTNATVDTGPSVHLSWRELQCHDGTPYPSEWRDDRAHVLGMTFEAVRDLLGGLPLVILSGYRTAAYNSTVEGAALNSQHVQGRALDIAHPRLSARAVFDRIFAAQRRGELPLLGGLGLYGTFVHMDVRPKSQPGHLATWTGKGISL